MPWHVDRTDQCPVLKPFGVIKDSDGTVDGRCHETREAAMRQMRALYAREGVMAMGDLLGVELARPGKWPALAGLREFTAQHLQDAAEFFAASGGQAVPVKIGHFDERFSGEPSFGSVINIRYTEDELGPVLLGDVVDMPVWLSAAAPKRWPNRSIEGWQNFEYEGRTYSLVLAGLALLGATTPAMRNLKSLTDVQRAVAASAAEWFVASAPAGDSAASPKTPDPNPETGSTMKEGAGMDPAKIREAMGLPADASDEDVRKAVVASGLFPAASTTDPVQPPPTPPQPTPPAPEKPEEQPEEPEERQEQQLKVAASAAPGTVILASSVWEDTQKTIKRLQSFVDKTVRDERDQVIAQAVQDGKFAPVQKTHFARLWDADPEGTRTLIDNLTRNSAVAVLASGYADDDASIDQEFAHLFPPTTTHKGA